MDNIRESRFIGNDWLTKGPLASHVEAFKQYLTERGLVPAEHSADADLPTFKSGTGAMRHFGGGAAVGYVLEFENGFKIYHTGDTDVFGDMALINSFFKPYLALVCIGGHFTMDPERAAYALRELIRPKQVIPMHYGTTPLVNRTPAELRDALGDAPIKVLDMKPGDAVKF